MTISDGESQGDCDNPDVIAVYRLVADLSPEDSEAGPVYALSPVLDGDARLKSDDDP